MSKSVFSALAFLLLLTACASGPTIRYFPPQATIKELKQQPDGQWQIQIRIQNFSTGAMDFSEIKLKLQFQDGEWAEIGSPESVNIGANNAELLTLKLPLSASTREIIRDRQEKSQPLRYRLEGSLRSRDPGRSYPLKYEGRLNPAPGLAGVYR
ncbi:LEA type 2 family protein [Arenimonas sp. GDDSR-1]|uniref:NDR1/HIN1-like protein n=1 Tax=Arenimonas sp. GDDSR-1 TaxID=2950125 RepID=UPI00261FD4B7|nr:LEA type 2 family protein [Arenimonas sp. GDDSR-1]